MKNSIVTLAIAAILAAPAVSFADTTLYGNVHLSISDQNSKDNLDMQSNTSSIGVKGAEDLGHGMKAFYKAEFQFDGAEGGATGNVSGNALTQRDVFVGIKAGFGAIKLGTFSSNYKQNGGKVDSLYRTRLEGRGLMNTQSNLHSGRSDVRGRMTNALSYTSPKTGGIQFVVNSTFNNSADETVGFGVRWADKAVKVYADTITVASGATTETAAKVGASFKAKSYRVAGQFESADDVTNYNYLHLNASFKVSMNNSVEFTVGQATHKTTSASDTSSFAVAYNHKMSKLTNAYIGFGDKSSDTAALEDSIFTVGIKKKF